MRNVAAHACDLSHECGGDRAYPGRGRQEHGLDVGRHRLVHSGHLHFIVEIGAVAQAADEQLRAFALRRRDDEIGKGRDLQFAAGFFGKIGAGLLQHGRAFLGRKQRRLAGMNADRKHEPAGQPDGLADDVEMAVGDRIERPGIKGGTRHVGGSSPAGSALQDRLRPVPRPVRQSLKFSPPSNPDLLWCV